MLRLYRIDCGEIDWVCARDEDHALEIYRNEYGLNDAEIAEAEVIEVDPSEVEVYLDDFNYDDDEAEPKTADLFMDRPGIVCSTNNY